MKFTAENLKNYLKYTHQVLGVSHIFQSNSVPIEAVQESVDRTKIFKFYYWPQAQTWVDFSLDDLEKKAMVQTLFVFFSTHSEFQGHLQNQTELISKMNQALGGTDRCLLIAWLSPNGERDLFSMLSQWVSPLKVVLFRQETGTQDAIYASGPHSILETLTPMNDPSDKARKRYIWNDFKRWMASLSG
ncbi:MAG: hypothetical protein JNL11_18785 [Bdellovibrionaceae bacterium]|nr:hypothetical protein [Pseudobdellovibrionaceae bacterium]